jgi:hypothetical protein
MRLYARSDVMAVAIPASEGGCGEGHLRPFVQGASSKLWPLDCPLCTQVLRNDPLWHADKLKIPLTPDEESLAEDMEKKGDAVMHQVSAALAQNSIQAMRDSQQQGLESYEAAQKREAAEARTVALESELAQMKAMLAQLTSVTVTTGASTGTSASGIFTHARNATVEYAQKTHGSAQVPPQTISGSIVTDTTPDAKSALASASGACTSCGGPLRLKGARGPTPKGTCMACRAKARKAA